MAEVVTSIPKPQGIHYSEWQLNAFARKFSRLKPVEPGDKCCNCGTDCDGEGFNAFDTHIARRVNGHPLCSRPKCYDAQLDEFWGKRSACGCGVKDKAKH